MIEIRDLHHHYADGTPALRGVSLTVSNGEFLLLCGANGSGKTTLIRHLNGLLKPSSGTVAVDGLDVSRNEREAVERVGMVFQDADSQIVGETVREDIAFGPENMGCTPEEVKERVDSALETTGLARLSERPCHMLSGGEKRRLAIAGVLAMRPQVLILDEPFANLDYEGIRQVLRQIVDLHGRGHTVIVTSHDVEKTVAHADRIAVLHRGELVAAGTPDEIVPKLPLYGVRQPCYHVFGQEAVSWLDD